MTNEVFSVSNERGEQLRSLARYHRTEVSDLVAAWIDRALADAGLNTPEPVPTQTVEEMLGDLEGAMFSDFEKLGNEQPACDVIEDLDKLDAI